MYRTYAYCPQQPQRWPWPAGHFPGVHLPGTQEVVQGYRSVDIKDELLNAANDALEVWATAVTADESGFLFASLRNVCELMQGIRLGRFFVFLELGGDDLELRTGKAFLEVDGLLSRQDSLDDPVLQPEAVTALKQLHRHCMDVLSIACGRFLDPTVLHCRGIPTELKVRLEAALGINDLRGDTRLWSIIGNSKYHVYTPTAAYKTKHRRHGRGSRKSRQIESYADEVDLARSADPSDSEGLAVSDPATRVADPSDSAGLADSRPATWRPRIADAHVLAEPSQASGWPPIVIAGPAYVSLPSWYDARNTSGKECPQGKDHRGTFRRSHQGCVYKRLSTGWVEGLVPTARGGHFFQVRRVSKTCPGGLRLVVFGVHFSMFSGPKNVTVFRSQKRDRLRLSCHFH